MYALACAAVICWRLSLKLANWLLVTFGTIT